MCSVPPPQKKKKQVDVITINLWAVHALVPPLADAQGNTTITVLGRGFADLGGAVWCSFGSGSAEAQGVLLNSTAVLCITPQVCGPFLSGDLQLATKRKEGVYSGFRCGYDGLCRTFFWCLVRPACACVTAALRPQPGNCRGGQPDLKSSWSLLFPYLSGYFTVSYQQ